MTTNPPTRSTQVTGDIDFGHDAEDASHLLATLESKGQKTSPKTGETVLGLPIRFASLSISEAKEVFSRPNALPDRQVGAPGCDFHLSSWTCFLDSATEASQSN